MDAFQAKILTMVCLGTSSLAAGLIPSWFMSSRPISDSLILSSFLCCGSGILLATCMVHMLPEVHEDLPRYAELLACGGFLLLFFIEELINAIKGKQRVVKTCNYCLSTTNPRTSTYGSVPRAETFRQFPYNPEMDEGHSLVQRCSCNELGSTSTSDAENSGTNIASHIGLLLALGIHSVLEGLAIGIQGTASRVIILASAVAAHKLVVAFGLGMELTANRENSKCGVMCGLTTFSLCSIIGIGFGMFFTTEDLEIPDLLPILQGLAVGTLMYVTLSEVLPRERSRFLHSGSRYSGIVQFIAVMIGFGIMSSFSIFLDPHQELHTNGG